MTDADNQAVYAAKRSQHGLSTVQMIEYRVILPDGSENLERAVSLLQIATSWPEAIRVERVDACGGFY